MRTDLHVLDLDETREEFDRLDRRIKRLALFFALDLILIVLVSILW